MTSSKVLFFFLKNKYTTHNDGYNLFQIRVFFNMLSLIYLLLIPLLLFFFVLWLC